MRSAISRALVVWLLLMAVESVHGTLRTFYLVPVMGDATARRLSVLTGAIVIFLVTLVAMRWLRARRTGHLLGIGALWVVLTVAFELLLGRLVFRMDWARIASDYDLARGGLMGPGLLCMLFTPLVAARLRGIRLPDQ